MKRKLLTLFIVILLIAGLGVLLYPTFMSLLSKQEQAYVVSGYNKSIETKEDKEKKAALEAAREYNKTLGTGQLSDPFTSDIVEDEAKKYLSLLNTDGVMAELEVPKIDLTLPVYHGTSEAVLQKGAGHLYGTSLPVGGEGTHAVITGHRGLPESTLFTNLDKIEKGDRFYIKVMGETLAYEVDSIKVVEPTETEDLQIVPGEDYVTLLTCTPYGINSHRLLVRGTRVSMPPEKAEEEAKVQMLETKSSRLPYIISTFVIIILACFLIFIFIFWRRRAEHK